MEFNKIKRGAKRAVYVEQSVYDILDAGFLCHIAFQSGGQTMIIPTAYGRKEDVLYFHGSTKNHMLNELVNGQSICVSVTHLDGVVLARTLFDTSANYRSVVLFGNAQLVTDEEEREEGLKIITDQIIPGRWEEVPVGTASQLKATMVVKFTISRASAKVRAGGPEGDEEITHKAWSGHIPLSLKASAPIPDTKFGEQCDMTASVQRFWEHHQ
jgi:nitroimidazol reductase NimA-like FMN-containing flavoprotein (pyridoxamine 5'-phosphate oxidase superfamily)